jgi:hypothetical protein
MVADAPMWSTRRLNDRGGRYPGRYAAGGQVISAGSGHCCRGDDRDDPRYFALHALAARPS